MPVVLAGYLVVPPRWRNAAARRASASSSTCGARTRSCSCSSPASASTSSRARRSSGSRTRAGRSREARADRGGRPQPRAAVRLEVHGLRASSSSTRSLGAGTMPVPGHRAADRHLVLHVPRHLLRRGHPPRPGAADAPRRRLRAVHGVLPAADRRPDRPLPPDRRPDPRSRRRARSGSTTSPRASRASRSGCRKKVLIADQAGARRRRRVRGGRPPTRARRRGSARSPTRCRSTSTSPATATWRSGWRACSASASRRTSPARTRAVSMTDFWRRWHMTLSRWFRDYVYIPLGGSRGADGDHGAQPAGRLLPHRRLARRGVDLRALGPLPRRSCSWASG